MLIGVGVAGGVGLMVLTLLPFAHGLDLGFLAAGAEMAGGTSVLYPRLDAGRRRDLQPDRLGARGGHDALAGAHAPLGRARSPPWARSEGERG